MKDTKIYVKNFEIREESHMKENKMSAKITNSNNLTHERPMTVTRSSRLHKNENV